LIARARQRVHRRARFAPLSLAHGRVLAARAAALLANGVLVRLRDA
jgi:hypothetical protein